MKPPIPYMGLYSPHPYFIFTSLPFILILLKISLVLRTLNEILALNKNKYHIASGGHPDPLLQRYNTTEG